MNSVFLLIVFLPLIGALIAGLFGTAVFRRLSVEGVPPKSTSHPPGDHAAPAADAHHDEHHHPTGHFYQYLTSGLLVVAALLSWYAFYDVAVGENSYKVEVLRWIRSGGLAADWVLKVDTLTAVMLVVVTTVSALVHIYSIGYMSHDPHQPRFFSYLSLFTFAMLVLVSSDNLVQLYFGWEGVGLASYLLIGFWYDRASANAAAIKAFVVNRVGDFGFALGIFATYKLFGSIEFDTLFSAAPEQVGKTLFFLGHDFDAMTTICLLLFMGAMGKSAQIFLHTWLPDAMEGPTPVSALIHAATMVTAGVFLVARMSPFFELSHDAQTVVIVVGAVTAFLAGTVGLVQNDIKRVIAYSTCSQLGYMFAAMGVGAYGVGMFHLFTHAFFKALLFLGSGSVIHAMSGEQDMRRMGGLRDKLKRTWILMGIGTLALTGFPLTAGYYSKDAIIEVVYAASGHLPIASLCFLLLLISAFFTAFYSWRLMFMTFHGAPRATPEVMSHVHESSPVMLMPLYILAAGSLFAGMLFASSFIGEEESLFWGTSLYRSGENNVLQEMHHVGALVAWSPFVMMIAGFALAWLFYIRDPRIPVRLAARHEPLYRFLLNKWYFDEIYDALIVRPTLWLGRALWKYGDGWLIDGLGPDGVSARVIDVTNRVVRLQTGYLYHYAFAMLIGIAAFITWYTLAGIH